jgi:hypothetical protein
MVLLLVVFEWCVLSFVEKKIVMEGALAIGEK